MTSSVRKQRERDTGVQLTFSCRLQLSPQPMAWGCPCSGWLVPPQLNLSGNLLTDKPGGVTSGDTEPGLKRWLVITFPMPFHFCLSSLSSPVAPFFIPVSSLLHMYTVIHLHVINIYQHLKENMQCLSLNVINFNDYVRFYPFLCREHIFFLMLFSDWPISCQAWAQQWVGAGGKHINFSPLLSDSFNETVRLTFLLKTNSSP